MLTEEELKKLRLEDVLEHQYGALARWQARLLGISDDGWDRRTSSGQWEARHKAVIVDRGWRHHEWAPSAAAVLRAGPGAHLAVWSGADLLGLNLRQAPDELLRLWVRHSDRRPRPAAGLILRRSRHLSSGLDITVRKGLPVTSRERAVVDRLGLPMHWRERESLLAEVLQLRLTTEARLAACAARNLGGAAVLRQLLGLLDGHDSGDELELDRLARSVAISCEAGITVVHLDGTRDLLDLFDEETGTNLESDGWSFHRDPKQREADELRDERLRGIGLAVARFTHRQVWHKQAESRRRIVETTAGRRWTRPPGVELIRPVAAAA